MLERAEIDGLIGMELPADEIINQLGRMGFGAKELEDGRIEVQIPRYRADILDNSDIIEDIAVGYGFDKIPASISDECNRRQIPHAFRHKH